MSILFVCHSIGDSNVLLESARKVLDKSQDKLVILTIGQAAKTSVEKLATDDKLKQAKQVKILSLANILGEEEMQQLENKALSESQLAKLKSALEKYEITKALIGTPSQINAQAALQIAEIIAAQVTPESGYIFNDYFYKENNHCYWHALEQKSTTETDWRKQYTWLAPLPKAEDAILKTNSLLKTLVTGHPGIDAVLEQKQPDTDIIAGYRRALSSKDHAILFISGTKDLSDDKTLLQEFLTVLAKEENLKLQIRVGLHPGNQNLENYILEMLAMLEAKQFAKISECIQLVMPDALAARIKNSEILKNSHILRVNLSGDQAACAADAVASAVPSTLVNQAAISGKPAYYHQAKESYLSKERLFVGKQNIPGFFSRVNSQSRLDPVTKKELGLPLEGAAETIAQHLLRS